VKKVKKVTKPKKPLAPIVEKVVDDEELEQEEDDDEEDAVIFTENDVRYARYPLGLQVICTSTFVEVGTWDEDKQKIKFNEK
jgi:hypothetical protein